MKKCNEFWGKMVGRYKIDDMYFDGENCVIVTDLHKDKNGDEYYLEILCNDYDNEISLDIVLAYEHEVIELEGVDEIGEFITNTEFNEFINIFKQVM